MSQQQRERTRPGTIPGQRQAGPEASATPPAPAPVAPVHPWDAQSWRTVARVAGSRAVLAVVVGLLLWSVLPLAVGWTPRVILSGSMEPRISTGDIVVTRPIETTQIEAGQVLTVLDPDKPGRTRTHRFVEWNSEDQLVTRGDANAQADSTPVSPDDVLGVGVIRVPYVGLPASWISERDLAPLGLVLAALSGLVLAAWTPRPPGSTGGSTGGSGEGGNQRDGGAGDVGETRRPGRRRGRRQGRLAGAAVTAMAGAVVATAIVAPASYAAFSAKAPNPASSFTAASAFSTVTYLQEVLGDSPVLYWRLNESSGTTATGQVSSRHGTVDNPRWGQSGALRSEPANGALGIDGGSIQQNANLNVGAAWSAELWVKSTRTTGGPLMVLYRANGTIDRALYVGRDGKVRFTTTGTAQSTGSTDVQDGGWHQVVYTSATSGAVGQRGRLYVDGRLEATGTTASTTFSGYWRVGNAQWSGTADGNPDQSFRGNVDEVAVYHSALTAAQVASHYAAAGY